VSRLSVFICRFQNGRSRETLTSEAFDLAEREPRNARKDTISRIFNFGGSLCFSWRIMLHGTDSSQPARSHYRVWYKLDNSSVSGVGEFHAHLRVHVRILPPIVGVADSRRRHSGMLRVRQHEARKTVQRSGSPQWQLRRPPCHADGWRMRSAKVQPGWLRERFVGASARFALGLPLVTIGVRPFHGEPWPLGHGWKRGPGVVPIGSVTSCIPTHGLTAMVRQGELCCTLDTLPGRKAMPP
jgi:hypothetical protein